MYVPAAAKLGAQDPLLRQSCNTLRTDSMELRLGSAVLLTRRWQLAHEYRHIEQSDTKRWCACQFTIIGYAIDGSP